ncbi:MAG: 1-acyl-sn-glycerol-3-phosphate acyltransferase [Bacilli bacterium]|nr:1-acyl-sn-glycerol-3-phosphate acyltransferase [Bacilli bacterium]
MEILMDSDLENLSLSDKKDYYKKLREKCLLLKDKQLHVGQGLIKNIYPFFRGYKLELEGVENIPVDSNVLFLFNHSNSHDIFTAYEILSQLQRKGSVMVATDCLNPITTEIFNISNATLLDRRNKDERQNSILRMSRKILEGNDGVIFGESTWNLHPTLLMHNIRKGVASISAITQVPVIPTVVEYIEKDEIIKTESDLYKKCLIRFGKPIMIDYDIDLISQICIIKESMMGIRNQIWQDYDINREKLSDVDPYIYINHTYLKKFKAFGFTYDSQREQEYLLFLENEKKENEYTLDDNGNLKPGITEKSFELKKVLYK